LFAPFFICLEQIAALFVCFLIAEMKKILRADFIWKEEDGDLLGGFARIAGFFRNNRRHRGRMSGADFPFRPYTLF